jgi:hypothetical protein
MASQPMANPRLDNVARNAILNDSVDANHSSGGKWVREVKGTTVSTQRVG